MNTVPQIVASTALFFCAGASNKEYHAEIATVTGGHVVNFRFGRRGSALTSGSKTPLPVTETEAFRIFNRLVAEKTAKGYTPSGSGTPYVGCALESRQTNFAPQLLNPLSEDEARALIDDPHWLAQEKMDGERRAVDGIVVDGKPLITGINRKGLVVPLPEAIAAELGRLVLQHGHLRFDGEQIGEVLHVFDLLIQQGQSLTSVHWQDRMRLATQMLDGGNAICAVPVAESQKEKRALWYGVQTRKGEGIVFKRASAPITPGRPNSGGDWRKYKFTATASCLVTALTLGKRSVQLGLYAHLPEGTSDATPVAVGKVTIPPNHVVPEVGAIVEVAYLYAYPGGALYQPVYQGERTDLSPEDCTLDQLKLKPETEAQNDAAAEAFA